MIYGLPNQATPPKYTLKTFCTYIPKLKEWATDPAHKEIFREFVEKMKKQLSYSYFLDDWKYAVSLAVAHYIIITDEDYAQSVSEDSTAGGVMSSRSSGGLSYSYDVGKTHIDNQAYAFWYKTGYGTTLVQLTNARGYMGMLVSD